ncbi:hypothetical protein Rhe02_90400 [Rhizocola hellebori]|uniref:MFS transporter n=1 Tax=Rhizocola hellebori TaxID=1392758 RepID=A0A8J3QKB8_9ACTN|nr:MFS transporter [Rhizocola hellebori]GIH10973.1 hypothetical protein Rhe02_90400 [Rhizocola hellebori]
MARLLDQPGYARFWTSETVSTFGTYVSAVAMPLVASFTVRATEFEFGLLTGARYAPYLAFGLLAGVIADRYRRRPLLISMDLGRFLLLGLLTGLLFSGTLTLYSLMAFVALAGTMSLFYEAAHQSYLPRLVQPDVLPRANARLQLSGFVAQTTGPLLGGSLIRLIGLPLSLAVDACSYLASAVLLATIKRPEPAPEVRPRHLKTELREGLSWVYRHRVLAPYAVTLHAHFLFESMASVVFTLLVLQGLEPGLPEKEAGFRLGVVLAIGGVGAVAGSWASGWAGRLGMGRLLVRGRWLAVLGWALAAVAGSGSAGWVMAAASQFVVWFAIGLSSPHELGYRQAVTPDRLQGRMNATIRSLNWGMLTIGAPVGGLLTQSLGYRGALWLATTGIALTALAATLSPVRHARHPAADPQLKVTSAG